jgi:DNA replication protein DnaC
MAYSSDVIRRAKARLAQEKANTEAMQHSRLQEAYEKLPRLRQIDSQLRKSMVLAAQAAFSGTKDALEQVRQANKTLQQERAALIKANFPADFLSEKPVCPHCGGEGYVGSTMCSCLTELCRQEQMKELSLLNKNNEDFSLFRLDYYPDRIDPNFGASPRAIMARNFDICRKYADGFSMESGNLLFVGNTGLGKTFLSACIARVAADKGYSVAYESAPHLMRTLEKDRFDADADTAQAVKKITSCDLLIIDDLGTELPGNFVTAALYALVNDRLLANKPTVISTNLNIDEIARRYSPQIASRLQGSFQRLTFVGEDIRVLKNRG